MSLSQRLARLGRLCARRPRTVLLCGLLLFAALAAAAAPTASSLVLSRFEAPGSESDRVATALTEDFGTGRTNITVVVTVKDGDVDAPAAAAAGERLTEQVAAYDGVLDASSYWTRDRAPTLRSEDGAQALVLASAPGDADRVRREVLPGFLEEFTRDTAAYTSQVGGGEAVFLDASTRAASDFARAEAVIFPAVFLLLLLVLRNAALAAAPLAAGVFTMAGTLALLLPVAMATELSTFALNITLVMGLALGVDYCLFLINRFREELAAGHPVADAVETTTATAGRTVVFSGLTVAASMAVLLALPFDFLRSFAYAGMAVVAAGTTASVVFLPAFLALLGTRASRRFGRPGGSAAPGGFWGRTAERAMRRPVATGGAVLVLLLVLAAPATGLRLGLPDERALPEDAPSRQAQEQISQGFSAEAADTLHVLPRGERPADDELDTHAEALSAIDGIARVETPTGVFADGARTTGPDGLGEQRSRYDNGDRARIAAVPTAERLDEDPFGLVQEVRSSPAAYAFDVGGYPADLVDYRDSLADRLPLLLALVLATGFTVLYLLTGSLLIPAKATLLNLLSLGVMFGVLVWGFQDGGLAAVLGFTPPGALDPSFPILMFCIAYGLSMDYEVFMLARIKEEYDRTGDTTAATSAGLQRSGPLISAAGAILALSFAAYATSGVMWLQMLGTGLALAILVDATLVRALLLPASMRLLGRANWWAPPPLRRLHQRIGVSD
ncbi:MMPL family transporter [Nocardiopsis chromatogenes]|uniref:MMPL family transporter n=1 Tax=Nocardiopsis chromatogenes TaxID=280239 RepID=UPI00034AFB95|nr:MMPL family transporter [Nocardiopsis chromatogenes]